MTDLVALEFPAHPSVLPLVRMVVGGMAARVDLSVDALDDMHMALEEIFYASREHGKSRCRLMITAESDALTVRLGPFASMHVVDRLAEPTCSLVARVVELQVLPDEAGGVSIFLTKRREAVGP